MGVIKCVHKCVCKCEPFFSKCDAQTKVDKIKHLLTPGNSRELEVLLARAGDGCVVNSGFTMVDRLANEKS